MATDKIDSSAVYALFEELKQKIGEMNNKTVQSAQPNVKIDTGEIAGLLEELHNFVGQKQFTSEQVKQLQENIAQFSAYSLGKAFEKLDTESTKITDILNRINEKLSLVSTPANFVIRKEHAFSVDFKNSKAAITMIVMGLIILLSLGGNVWQSHKNSYLKDNDLKYRYIKMQDETNDKALLKLETDFTYNRNKDSISVIRKRVESYERLVREQAERTERARLNASEAEQLQKEAERLKKK